MAAYFGARCLWEAILRENKTTLQFTVLVSAFGLIGSFFFHGPILGGRDHLRDHLVIIHMLNKHQGWRLRWVNIAFGNVLSALLFSSALLHNLGASLSSLATLCMLPSSVVSPCLRSILKWLLNLLCALRQGQLSWQVRCHSIPTRPTTVLLHELSFRCQPRLNRRKAYLRCLSLTWAPCWRHKSLILSLFLWHLILQYWWQFDTLIDLNRPPSLLRLHYQCLV